VSETELCERISPHCHCFTHQVRSRVASKLAENEHLCLYHPSDAPKIDYREQGDPLMNNPKAFAKRDKLRRHPKVVKSMRAWWAEIGGDEGVTKAEYIELGTCIAMLLIPDEASPCTHRLHQP
jgi:hypothetical protein